MTTKKTTKTTKAIDEKAIAKSMMKSMLKNMLRENAIQYVDCASTPLDGCTKDTLIALRVNSIDVQIKLICPSKQNGDVYIADDEMADYVEKAD